MKNSQRSSIVFKYTAEDVCLLFQYRGQRPLHADDTPIKVRQIMEIAWSDIAKSRPTFEQVGKMLRAANPCKKTVLDNMMEAMEDYTAVLEEKMEEHLAEMNAAKKSIEKLTCGLLPKALAQHLCEGRPLPIAAHSPGRATLAVLSLRPACAKLSAFVDPADMVTFLGRVHDVVDARCDEFDVCRVDETCDSVVLATGVLPGVTWSSGPSSADTLLGMVTATLQDLAGVPHPLCARPVANNNVRSVLNELETANRSCHHQTTAGRVVVVEAAAPCTLWMKAALHCGHVTVGVVGSRLPRLVVYGEALSDLKLLAAECTSCRVLLSESCVKRLSKRHQTDAMPHGRVSTQNGQLIVYCIQASDAGLRNIEPVSQKTLTRDINIDSQPKETEVQI